MEIDVAAGYCTVQDVDDMIQRIVKITGSVPAPTRLVIAADWRLCPLFTEPVAKRVVEMLARHSDRIERSAILHREDQPTSVLQVFRLLHEAEQTHRRIFTHVSEAEEWLGELLTEAERSRLHAFWNQQR